MDCFTIDQISKHDTIDDCWVILNNNVYNLTQFVNIHPGGKIILNYAGQDITSVFYSVHPISVIDKMDILNKYDKYKIGELVRYNLRNNINLTNYKKFRRTVNKEFTKKNKSFSILNLRGGFGTIVTLFILNSMVITFYIVYIRKMNILSTFILSNTIILTLLYQWHTSCHGALLKKPLPNLLVSLSGPLYGGISAIVWKREHNLNHHDQINQPTDTQHFNKYIRLSPQQEWKPKYKYQYLYAWCLYLFSSFNLKQQMPFQYKTKIKTKYYYVHELMLLFHCILFLFIPIKIYGFLKAIKFYFLMGIFQSIYLTIAFIPNHETLDCEGAETDWLKHQIKLSNNLRGGKITTFLFGGLNKQIEHHLFPSVHQHHLNKITPFVKKYCEQNNILYKEYSLYEVFKLHYKKLRLLSKSSYVFKN